MHGKGRKQRKRVKSNDTQGQNNKNIRSSTKGEIDNKTQQIDGGGAPDVAKIMQTRIAIGIQVLVSNVVRWIIKLLAVC